jgi:hypothetical protein
MPVRGHPHWTPIPPSIAPSRAARAPPVLVGSVLGEQRLPCGEHPHQLRLGQHCQRRGIGGGGRSGESVQPAIGQIPQRRRQHCIPHSDPNVNSARSHVEHGHAAWHVRHNPSSEVCRESSRAAVAYQRCIAAWVSKSGKLLAVHVDGFVTALSPWLARPPAVRRRRRTVRPAGARPGIGLVVGPSRCALAARTPPPTTGSCEPGRPVSWCWVLLSTSGSMGARLPRRPPSRPTARSSARPRRLAEPVGGDAVPVETCDERSDNEPART